MRISLTSLTSGAIEVRSSTPFLWMMRVAVRSISLISTPKLAFLSLPPSPKPLKVSLLSSLIRPNFVLIWRHIRFPMLLLSTTSPLRWLRCQLISTLLLFGKKEWSYLKIQPLETTAIFSWTHQLRVPQYAENLRSEAMCLIFFCSRVSLSEDTVLFCWLGVVPIWITLNRKLPFMKKAITPCL